jgi:hypothetical protein
MFAAQNGHVDIMRVLVFECKCDPAHIDNSKRSVLIHAATRGSVAAVQFLIHEAHVDVNYHDNVSYKPSFQYGTPGWCHNCI